MSLWTLYDTSAQLEAFLQLLEEHINSVTGEIDEEGEEILAEIERLSEKEENLIEDIIREIKNREAVIKALREEEKSLAERRRQHERIVQRLKDGIAGVLSRKGGKYMGKAFKVHLKRTRAVAEVDLDLLPDEIDGIKLKRIRVEPDKSAILRLDKAGIPVLGARIEERLSITIKPV